MPNLWRSVRSPQPEQRFGLEDYAAWLSDFTYGGSSYTPTTTYTNKPGEPPVANYLGYVRGVYKHNGVVFACNLARLRIFSQARLQWQQLRAGKPGDLFGNPDLAVLETPWINGSTGELLARMIQDVDLAGNAFIRRTGPLDTPTLERLRPDWVTIVLGSKTAMLNPEVAGYLYKPGGPASGADPVVLDRTEVAHWSPVPDPEAYYRGMSWLTPVLREIQGDNGATDHKNQFWSHGATPNMVVKFAPEITPEKGELWKALFEGEHRGAYSAYKTLYLGGGADVTTAGLDFKQMDFKTVQGHGETRIAAAAGVPPIIAGLSEGLEASTYSNYAQARRHFGDSTLVHLWQTACAALQSLVPVPARARLWYDTSGIAFLREDEKDAADIKVQEATTIRTLVDGGYAPDSVVAAVSSGDWSLLSHSGMLSVQLHTPGDSSPASDQQPAALPSGAVPTNGNGKSPVPA